MSFLNGEHRLAHSPSMLVYCEQACDHLHQLEDGSEHGVFSAVVGEGGYVSSTISFG